MTEQDDPEEPEPLAWLERLVEDWKEPIRDKLSHFYHWLHVVAHCAYFGAVYIEGHGFYAATGGALLILTVWGIVAGFSDE